MCIFSNVVYLLHRYRSHLRLYLRIFVISADSNICLNGSWSIYFHEHDVDFEALQLHVKKGANISTYE